MLDREEESGIAVDQDVEEEEEREMGKVKVCIDGIPSLSSFLPWS